MGKKIREMDGLIVLEAKEPITIVVGESNVSDAKPRNAEECALALCMQRQLDTPYVHVMRTIAFVALPCEGKEGRPVQGREGRWAMYKHFLSEAAMKAVIAVDLGKAVPKALSLKLLPVPANRSYEKRSDERTRGQKRRHPTDTRVWPGTPSPRDALTEAGVRNYSRKVPH